MSVSRGAHNRSIFVLIPTPSHLRVTVVQRQQQNRKNPEIHTEILTYTFTWMNRTVQIMSKFCAAKRENLGGPWN